MLQVRGTVFARHSELEASRPHADPEEEEALTASGGSTWTVHVSDPRAAHPCGARVTGACSGAPRTGAVAGVMRTGEVSAAEVTEAPLRCEMWVVGRRAGVGQAVHRKSRDLLLHSSANENGSKRSYQLKKSGGEK